MSEVLVVHEYLVVLGIPHLQNLQPHQRQKGQRGDISEIGDDECREEQFGSAHDRVPDAGVGRWQEALVDAPEVHVLKPIEELRVLIFVEVLAGVVGQEHRPSQRTDQSQHAEEGIDDFTSIAALGIGEVVELDKAAPHGGEELISPYLVQVVYGPADDVLYCPVEDRLLLIYEVLPEQKSPGEEEADEPDGICDIDDNDGVELPREVDVRIEEEELDGPILDHITQPRLLNLRTVIHHHEIQVLQPIKASNHIPESEGKVVCCDVDMQEQQLQTHYILLHHYPIARQSGNYDGDHSHPREYLEDCRESTDAEELAGGKRVITIDRHHCNHLGIAPRTSLQQAGRRNLVNSHLSIDEATPNSHKEMEIPVLYVTLAQLVATLIEFINADAK